MPKYFYFFRTTFTNCGPSNDQIVTVGSEHVTDLSVDEHSGYRIYCAFLMRHLKAKKSILFRERVISHREENMGEPRLNFYLSSNDASLAFVLVVHRLIPQIFVGLCYASRPQWRP